MLFSSLCYFPEPLFVSQSSWPERLFVSGVLIYVPQSRIYVPRCLVYFLESHIHFPELLIELLERFELLARCPEFMMYFHACSIWTIALTSLLIPCVLVVSCAPYLFLASFIYIRKFMIYFPEPLLYCQCFPYRFSRILFFPMSPGFFQGSEFLCIFPWISSAPLFPCLFR